MSRRAQVGLGILALWLLGLGALARRELFRPASERLAMAAMRVAPGASYYAVHRGDAQIGFASTTLDTTENSIAISDYLVAEIPVGGRYQRTTATTRVNLSRALRVRDFTLRLDAPSGAVHATGAMQTDSTLVLTLAADEEAADTQHLHVAEPILLPTLLPLAASLTERPRVGAEYAFPVLDPATMSAREMRMTVRAESLFVLVDSARLDTDAERWVPALRDTVRAWELVPAEPTLFLSWWVDELGRVVAAELPAGLRLQRTAYELAFVNWRIDTRDRPAQPSVERDVLESTAIAADVLVDRDELDRLRVRLGKVDLSGFTLDGGRQSFRDGILTIERESAAGLVPGYTLPLPDSIRFRAELAEEPLIQISHRSIRGLAAQLRGPSDDPRVVAERINRWVHGNLRKRVTIGVPSALGVFRSRSGDCNEHTQLYIALARSAGLPARAAAGLALVDGRFYYHAWPEVYLGTWVAVDPTFGQFPADAAHLRFTIGGLTRQVELLRLIGHLDLTVVEASERRDGAAR